MKVLSEEFEIPFYKYTIENWQTKKNDIKNIIDQMSNEFSNCSTYCYNNTSFKQDENTIKTNRALESIISSELELFYNEVSKKYYIHNSWIQIYNFKDSHSVHTHGFGYSGVLFVNFNNQHHLPPIFVAPFQSLTNPGEPIYFKPEVKEGDLLIFHSSILHFAPTNMSEQSRIIFSFNLTEQ